MCFTGKLSSHWCYSLNQKGQDMICIYVAIGQKESTVHANKKRSCKHEIWYTPCQTALHHNHHHCFYIAPTLVLQWLKRAITENTFWLFMMICSKTSRGLPWTFIKPVVHQVEAYPGCLLHLNVFLERVQLDAFQMILVVVHHALPIIQTQSRRYLSLSQQTLSQSQMDKSSARKLV